MEEERNGCQWNDGEREGERERGRERGEREHLITDACRRRRQNGEIALLEAESEAAGKQYKTYFRGFGSIACLPVYASICCFTGIAVAPIKLNQSNSGFFVVTKGCPDYHLGPPGTLWDSLGTPWDPLKFWLHFFAPLAPPWEFPVIGRSMYRA